MNLTVDIARLSAELDQLATYSETESPSVTRVLWTPFDMEARRYLRGLFEAAGLAVREDALGNTFARWEGSEPELPAVATGSHFDAIPYAGKYDGTLGVLGGLEAIRALQREGIKPRRALELIAFTSEEPTRFGLGCLGSRAMSGARSPQELQALTDNEGTTLDEARGMAGYRGDLAGVQRAEGVYHAFVELHIEQGPELERLGLPIGVVSAIAAPATLRVELTGVGGHAGATLMPGRRDALLAGAEIALAVEKAALGTGDINTVATTGLFEIHPGAVNSVPSRAKLEIDVRDTDGARRDGVVTQIQEAIVEIAAGRGIASRVELLNADPPATCAPPVVSAVEEACYDIGADYQTMVSRAYHDSLFMARLAPTGMIFIPSQGGISHRPDEYSSPQDIARGVDLLARSLAKLAE